MAVTASQQQSTPPTAPWPEFALWLLAQLHYPWEIEGDVVRVTLPPDERGHFDDRACLTFRCTNDSHAADAAEPQENGVETLSLGSALFEQLLQRLQATGPAAHCQPRGQLASVHEIAQTLFPAYQVSEGKMHLAGCSLDDRPFVRLTYARASTAGDDSSAGELRHLWFDAQGTHVAEAEIERLGLKELVPLETPPRLAKDELQRMLALARTAAARQLDEESSGLRLLAAAVGWCRHASGKLCVTIGEATAEFPFSGWTYQLQPKPLVCPVTGVETTHLALTYDGAIAAAEQIARCAETGRRVLRRDLLTCAASGKLALAERLVTCPVSEEQVLQSVLIECPSCHESVSPDALTHGICRACAAPPHVSKDDARLARLLGEYPGLDRWRRWRLSETATVYIAQARSLWRRLLLVVDKKTLELRHMAQAGILARAWQSIPPEERDEWLRAGGDGPDAGDG